MRQTRQKKTSSDWEEQASKRKDEQYVLRLYVTGQTPKSVRAIANIKAICEQHRQGRHSQQVIDICQRPRLAQGEQILAAPVLIKELPLPLRRLVGDLSKTVRVLLRLDLRTR